MGPKEAAAHGTHTRRASTEQPTPSVVCLSKAALFVVKAGALSCARNLEFRNFDKLPNGERGERKVAKRSFTFRARPVEYSALENFQPSLKAG